MGNETPNERTHMINEEELNLINNNNIEKDIPNFTNLHTWINNTNTNNNQSILKNLTISNDDILNKPFHFSSIKNIIIEFTTLHFHVHMIPSSSSSSSSENSHGHVNEGDQKCWKCDRCHFQGIDESYDIKIKCQKSFKNDENESESDILDCINDCEYTYKLCPICALKVGRKHRVIYVDDEIDIFQKNKIFELYQLQEEEIKSDEKKRYEKKKSIEIIAKEAYEILKKDNIYKGETNEDEGYRKCIEMYTYCIKKLKEEGKDVPFDYYANRSSCYFFCEEYTRCIMDALKVRSLNKELSVSYSRIRKVLKDRLINVKIFDKEYEKIFGLNKFKHVFENRDLMSEKVKIDFGRISELDFNDIHMVFSSLFQGIDEKKKDVSDIKEIADDFLSGMKEKDLFTEDIRLYLHQVFTTFHKKLTEIDDLTIAAKGSMMNFGKSDIHEISTVFYTNYKVHYYFAKFASLIAHHKIDCGETDLGNSIFTTALCSIENSQKFQRGDIDVSYLKYFILCKRYGGQYKDFFHKFNQSIVKEEKDFKEIESLIELQEYYLANKLIKQRLNSYKDDEENLIDKVYLLNRHFEILFKSRNYMGLFRSIFSEELHGKSPLMKIVKCRWEICFLLMTESLYNQSDKAFERAFFDSKFKEAIGILNEVIDKNVIDVIGTSRFQQHSLVLNRGFYYFMRDDIERANLDLKRSKKIILTKYKKFKTLKERIIHAENENKEMVNFPLCYYSDHNLLMDDKFYKLKISIKYKSKMKKKDLKKAETAKKRRGKCMGGLVSLLKFISGLSYIWNFCFKEKVFYYSIIMLFFLLAKPFWFIMGFMVLDFLFFLGFTVLYCVYFIRSLSNYLKIVIILEELKESLYFKLSIIISSLVMSLITIGLYVKVKIDGGGFVATSDPWDLVGEIWDILKTGLVGLYSIVQLVTVIFRYDGSSNMTYVKNILTLRDYENKPNEHIQKEIDYITRRKSELKTEYEKNKMDESLVKDVIKKLTEKEKNPSQEMIIEATKKKNLPRLVEVVERLADNEGEYKALETKYKLIKDLVNLPFCEFPDISLEILAGDTLMKGTNEILQSVISMVSMIDTKFDIAKYDSDVTKEHYDWDLLAKVSTEQIVFLKSFFTTEREYDYAYEECCYDNLPLTELLCKRIPKLIFWVILNMLCIIVFPILYVVCCFKSFSRAKSFIENKFCDKNCCLSFSHFQKYVKKSIKYCCCLIGCEFMSIFYAIAYYESSLCMLSDVQRYFEGYLSGFALFGSMFEKKKAVDKLTDKKAAKDKDADFLLNKTTKDANKLIRFAQKYAKFKRVGTKQLADEQLKQLDEMFYEIVEHESVKKKKL